jgi:hypothetical protein
MGIFHDLSHVILVIGAFPLLVYLIDVYRFIRRIKENTDKLTKDD